MYFLLRNIFFTIFLFIIIFSVFKCGSSTEERKEKASSEKKTYKNLSPDVKYVGIMACRQCHYDKYETFIETGMGKSFDKASKLKSSAKFDSHSVVHDKYSDLSYLPFWSGDSMKIMEFRLEGKDTVHKRIETVDYIIGSGQHTNSHIFNTNGYLHQMPMTFYTQDGKWDLPPGFESGFNTRFSRKIGLECMSCHNALPNFVEGSENKFDEIPNGISCERCHGPGEIHIKEKTAGIVVDTSKYIDYSIVNPAKLTIDLQFDVCQRCHLQGNAVLKEGKSFLDFRPGMKLSDVETIFLPKYEGADEDFIMASHAERLKQSKCFIETEDRKQKTDGNSLSAHKNGLTCITCHNPHVSVKATGKEVFNTKCNNCHLTPRPSPQREESKACSEKMEVRAKKQDNCVSCHMPRSGSIDIPHVTITDHFIRKPVKKTDMASVKKFLGLIAINEKNPDPEVIAEAYINQYEKFDKNKAFLDSAEKYLNKSTGINHNLLVRILFLKNEYKKIISLKNSHLFNQARHSYDNNDAWTCYRVAEAHQYLGRTEDAYYYYKRAVALAPYNLEFQNKLAGTLYNQNKKEEAKKMYENIISENPKIAPAWCNLGLIYLQNNNVKKAMEHYNKALSLDPDYELALLNKAGILLFEKKNSQALAVVKRILKKNPKNKKALAMQMHLK
ncbi:MAG: tetratricopeptide repeat protein [Bacteroidetes bacterium]|nr:MAG: tetratricopeptide repeat protein [Bacteroidota bacterium]